MAAAAELRRELAALGLALALLLAWELGAGDAWVAAALGGAQGFPARHSFWAQALLHDGLRQLYGLLLGLQLLRLAWPGRTTRRRRLLALLASLGALALVGALKSFSHSSCPWDLQDYGGVWPWVSHWDWLGRDGGPGRCFPSGHSAGAFALLSQAWLWRGQDARRARAWAAAVLLIGALGSAAQWARGAHFVSHSLWSAWLCLALGWLLLRAAPAMHRARAARERGAAAPAAERPAAPGGGPQRRPAH